MEQTGVIIVAGGSGSRMGGSKPKQFLFLEGVPVLARTINTFAAALPGSEIVVVLPAQHVEFWKNLAARFEVAPHAIAEGGEQRFHSVQNGIAALKCEQELIAVHDGVRPLASAEMILRTAAAAAEHGAAIPVVEPVDSLRKIDGAGSHIVDRSAFRSVQTPQIFRAEILRHAYRTAYRTEFTDDASVVELAGQAIHLCEGERSNIKITTPEDLTLAGTILTARENQDNDGE